MRQFTKTIRPLRKSFLAQYKYASYATKKKVEFNDPIFDYDEIRALHKQEHISKLIVSVLTDKANATKVTKHLEYLSKTVTNEQDFLDLLQLTLRVSSRMKLEGNKVVGNMLKKPPVKVAVTGAAGAIAYSLIPRIASGEMLGEDQPVILHLIDLPFMFDKLKGVGMEVEDCAFPLLRGLRLTTSLEKGFEDVDYALLVGAKPRGPGMERADLLKDNGKIFVDQGKAINDHAKRSCLSLVVGNPANTNCLVLSSNAPDIAPEQFSAMTRLDQDRAIAQVAEKANVPIGSVSDMNIWGNHSPTMFPDFSNAKIDGKPASNVITDKAWVNDVFIKSVQNRGAEIIKARGASSASSAGDAALKHMRDWALGSNGRTVSMAVPSDGSYGIKKGIYCSFPVVCEGQGKYTIVQNLNLTKAEKTKVNASVKELETEKSSVANLLK